MTCTRLFCGERSMAINSLKIFIAKKLNALRAYSLIVLFLARKRNTLFWQVFRLVHPSHPLSDLIRIENSGLQMNPQFGVDSRLRVKLSHRSGSILIPY